MLISVPLVNVSRQTQLFSFFLFFNVIKVFFWLIMEIFAISLFTDLEARRDH